MKTSRIIANNIETAIEENTEWMTVVATDEEQSVEVVLNTMRAPEVASSILLSSQEALFEIDPLKISSLLAKNLPQSMQILPEAVDISLVADGDVLCINVGSGTLFFRLSDPAKRTLNQPLKHR